MSLLLCGISRSPADRSSDNSETPFVNAYGVVVVEVRINNQGPFAFMLDTGSKSVVVSPQLAARIRLPSLGRVSRSGAGAGGDLSAIKTKLTASIGGITQRDIAAIELQLPENLAHRVQNLTIQGMIGCDFFKDAVLTVDYRAGDIIIAKGYDPGPGSVIMQMRLAMGGRVPAVMANFDGVLGSFLVDTGNSAWPSLTHSFAVRSGIDKRYPSGTPLTSETAGNQQASLRKVCLDQFNLGRTIGMTHVPIYLSQADYGVARWPDLDGSIGYEILRWLRPTFDFRKHLVYFSPTKIKPGMDYATTADCVPAYAASRPAPPKS